MERKIRTGKDFRLMWAILTNTEEIPLAGRDLRLDLIDPLGKVITLPIEIEGNKVISTVRGKDFLRLGVYRLTLWENYGQNAQTAVDCCEAFRLVSTTCQEGGEDPEGLDTETIDLGTSDIQVSFKGDPGDSAYEIAVKNDFKGTEEEWLASLKGDPFTYEDFTTEQIEELQQPALEAAESANNAAAEANKATGKANTAAALAETKAQEAENAANKATQTEAAIQQAETSRVSAEKIREENEAVRIASETAREKAEQGRVSAEQGRVSAESSRVSAEQTRVSAETQRDTEFARLKEESETATNNANQAADKANQTVVNVLLKTDQTLTDEEQDIVQTNIGVKDLMDYVFDGRPTEIIPEIWLQGKSRSFSGSFSDNPSMAISNPIQVKYGDVISFTSGTQSGYSILSEIKNDEAHTFIRSLALGDIGKAEFQVIADKNMYVEFSNAINSISRPVKIQSVNIINNLPSPNGGYYKDLFEATYSNNSCRALFNKETGFYELNGLTDLTESDMITIYNHSILKDFDISGLCRRGRTNMSISLGSNSPYGYYKAELFCYGNPYIEILVLPFLFNPTQYSNYNFTGCKKLREIKRYDNHGTDYGDVLMGSYTFEGCESMEYVLCKGLSKTQNFCKDSPYINYESVKYLIDKAANTSAITITVHPTTYGYLTGEIEPTEQVGGTTEEWQQILTGAAAKQISFASA